MRLLRKISLRFRSLLRRNAVERELDSELRFHLEQQIAENIAGGLALDEARLKAMRTIGGLAQIEEECRDARGTAFLESLIQDVRYGLRQLRRAPGFTVVAVLTLALGIGANTAIFTVMNALMFKSLPVKQAERLVQLKRGNDDVFTYELWKQLRDQQDIFSGAFAISPGGPLDLATGGEKRIAHGIMVTGDFFSTLGIGAVLGRTLNSNDDARGLEQVAVISYAFWQRQFGRDPQVVGRWITLDKHSFRIIGVTPPGFFGIEVGDAFDVAVPLEAVRILEPTAQLLEEPRAFWINILARLKRGVTIEQANARLAALSYNVNLGSLPPQFLPEERTEFLKQRLTAVPGAGGISSLRARYRDAVLLLAGMVAVLLLIACANVANLLLARASARRHEFAVRVALGARRVRLLRQLLTESLMLAGCGAALGLIFYRWAGNWLVRATSSAQYPRSLDLSPDVHTIAFVAGATLFTTVVFGLAPALRAAKAAPQSTLKDDSRTTISRRWDATRLLIAAQVALSVLLLFAAALLVRSLRDLTTQHLGFESDGVLLLDTDINLRTEDRERQLLSDGLLLRLQNLPGVRAASRSAVTPISGMSWQWDITSPQASKVHVFANLITADFFDTFGIPFVSGRKFTEADTAQSPIVAIVNQSAARKLFPAGAPVGQRLSARYLWEGKAATVIGVVGDAKYRRLRDEAPPTIYIPIAQNPSRDAHGNVRPVIGTFAVRFTAPLAQITREIKRAAAEIDPHLSLQFTPLATQVRNSVRQERLVAGLSSIFAGLALLLAAIGIYGVMAYAVARRTNEIGVRMALGARRSRVLAMVLREALVIAAAGIAIGLPAAIAASRLIKAMLFGVRAADPIIIVTTIALIVAVAAFAAYIPARRAARIDPIVALRYE